MTAGHVSIGWMFFCFDQYNLNFAVRLVTFYFIAEFSSSQVVQSNKNQSVVLSARSGFFDLGAMFGQLYPDLNQGYQGGSQSNPGGMGFPANSQFYPDSGVQVSHYFAL